MKIILTLLFAMSLATAFSQEGENFSCQCCNSAVKQLAEGKTIPEVYVHFCGSGTGSGGLASSYLKPTGTPPKVEGDPKEGAVDYSVLEAWTCRYAPGLITDGDTKTAWVEGSKDYGVGELVLVSCIDLKKPVQIWSGYGKSAAIFTQNSRPKKIKVMVVQSDAGDPTQYGSWYRNVKVIKESELELKDLNGFQSLVIPAFDVQSYKDKDQNKREYNYFLGIVILDVYKGTKYSDTCISEVRNVPK